MYVSKQNIMWVDYNSNKTLSGLTITAITVQQQITCTNDIAFIIVSPCTLMGETFARQNF